MSRSEELVHVPALQELASREANGIRVDLLYQQVGNIVLVHILDEKAGSEHQFSVPNDKALDAFEHPYSYVPEVLAAA